MTRFDNFPKSAWERAARNLLSHVEAAAERENLPPPAEAQNMASILLAYDFAPSTKHKEPNL